jgi:hypothetical protein
MSVNNTIPFLDVKVEKVSNDEYRTSVYRKPTDLNKCLNPASECPDRYKSSVIKSYIHRAYKTCTTNYEIQLELKRSKQILVNNGFTNHQFDNELRNYKINSQTAPSQPSTNNEPTKTDHKVFYCNQMSSAYKADERALHSIIDRNVLCRSPNDSLKVIIYYKNKTIKQLVSTNNPAKKSDRLQSTNVLYEFKCPKEDCKLLPNVQYIGLTTTTLSRRLTMHLTNGGPRNHMMETHAVKVTRKDLEENTVIINKYHDKNRLAIAEAIYIQERAPSINLQSAGFMRTLKLFC